MKEDDLNKFSDLLKDKSRNLYIYVSADVDDYQYEFGINFHLPDTILTDIVKFINEAETKNVVLICRSEKEQYNEEFPKKEQIEFIKSSANKKVSIFYQNPWPESVPNFIDTDTIFIRFGFDEGCLFDKYILGKKFISNYKNMESYYLLSKDKLVTLRHLSSKQLT